MIIDRPEKVTEILVSLKYWDKKNMIIFLKKFIKNNCKKIDFVVEESKIDKVLNLRSEKDLKIEIINLLQNIKNSTKVVLEI